MNIDEELSTVLDGVDTETKGSRFYARKFKNLYVKVRKALVVLNKSRKEIGNEEAYKKAVEVIDNVLSE